MFFFDPPNKYDQFCFIEWILSCLKPNEYVDQSTDVVIQIFVLFHLRPMWLFYRDYKGDNNQCVFFENDYEDVFTERQIAILYENIPSDCKFLHAHPIEPSLLDFFSVEFYKENTQWKSRFINFENCDDSVKQTPQIDSNGQHEDISLCSERSCEEYEE